jgi:hypothetical protein
MHILLLFQTRDSIFLQAGTLFLGGVAIHGRGSIVFEVEADGKMGKGWRRP